MKNQNLVTAAAIGEPTARITRARAAACPSRGLGMLISDVSKQQDQKRVSRKNFRKATLEERNNSASVTAGNQHKRRAVLKDVTNVSCDNSYKSCFNAVKNSEKSSSRAKKDSPDVSKVVPFVAVKIQQSTKIVQKKPESAGVLWSSDDKADIAPSSESNADIPWPDAPQHGMHPQRFPDKEEEILYEKKTCKEPEFTDIDSDNKDPQLCSHYASDIYNNLRVAELMRKPYFNPMETVQRDITQSMRGILVDWLVEVCEEYKLVPDTLYLTVYLVDWFLSQYYIERQRLQLLGITCMLIASKYEEICPPRVEDFCFITDNTYTRIEVITMESKVLNDLRFRLCVPTPKTFLRRFLRAAQASFKSPGFELEFLANYLAELTLVAYGFLKLRPSIVAASAVFLARWTLDQSNHPWNPTLEHYTCYKASDLKTTVVELQALQLNTSGCPLNAIRAKYRQEKFKSVASLSSPELVETLF